MEAMIGLLLSWPDEWCAVLHILCQKILCQSVDTYVPRLALEAGARSWSPKACKELHAHLFKAPQHDIEPSQSQVSCLHPGTKSVQQMMSNP